jgi:hypothetical protein
LNLERETDQHILWQYLLGELDDSGQEQVELRYLEDRDYLEALRLAEDDLIDSYVNGRLTPVSREHFETNFLNSPERIARVRFAETLRLAVLSRRASPINAGGQDVFEVDSSGTVDDPALPQIYPGRRTPPRGWFLGWGGMQWAALGAIVLLVFGAILAVRVLQLSRELDALRGEQREARDTIEGLNRKIQEEEAQAHAPRTVPTPEVNRGGGTNKGLVSPQSPGREIPKAAFSLVLSPGLSRGSTKSLPTIELGGQGSVVLTLLGVEAGYDRYRVSLTADAGTESFLPGRPRVHGRSANKTISVAVKMSELRPADYRLKLYGIRVSGDEEYLAAYYFKVLSDR